MAHAPRHIAYPSMGTRWQLTVWDPMEEQTWVHLAQEVQDRSHTFDRTYSRFIKSSLIWSLATQTGRVTVPKDLVAMLRLYASLYKLSEGKCTPLIGETLRDLGYDEQYSLRRKEQVHAVPDFPETVRILDDEHIELRAPALIDVGALGKGFFVDRLADLLRARGLKHFLVDGSGDLFYSGDHPIRVGLEHPTDHTLAIGVVELAKGALCGSGGGRRAWNGHHHIIDPATLSSPARILATWVTADTAALADGVATCVFLTPPERYTALGCEYCILNDTFQTKRSPGFQAELFTA